MSDAEDRIEEPFINSNMSPLQHHAPTAQKRKMSHSDHIDSGTPPLHIDPSPSPSPSTTQAIKVAYNGPSSIYVVMLRVHNESSARPMPQAAFFDRNKALAFSTRVLLHGEFEGRIGGEVCGLSCAEETEVVVKKGDVEEDEEGEDSEDSEGDEEDEKRLDDAEHQEESEENSESTGKLPVPNGIGTMTDKRTETTSTNSTQTQGPVFETTLAHSAQGEEEEIDLETLSALLAHGHQAPPGMYATGLATRLAKNDEQDAVSGIRHRGAWREDHEMRVFGGSTEHDTY
ncbi:hypothetical protein KCU65_g211, partial [Aureobasidium melanogenum]